jgi:spore coat protein CotH
LSTLVRAILSVSRKVNKLKNEFPNLYNDFQNARKQDKYAINTWIKLSEEGSKEYDRLVEKYLAVSKFPNSNRKVWITTANGGKFVGFYENYKWWYETLDSVLEVKSQVIKWERYK